MSEIEPTSAMMAILLRLAEEDGDLPDPTTLPSAEGRALAARTNVRWNRNLPDMASVRRLALAGLDAAEFTPPNDEERGAILYIHGGGWAFCSKETHERCTRALAVAAAAPVVSIDYRLAPEAPFPAGLEDCVAGWDAFAAAYEGRALAIAGDSAGANLALAVMLNKPRAMPATGLLFYGVYGADFASPSYTTYRDGPGLTRAKMQRFFDWYVPLAARANPLVCPLEASDAALAALPPLLVNAAGIDPLRSDTERLAERLAGLGRADTVLTYEGVVHGFMQMSELLPEAREAIADAGRVFRATITT
ncbi:alpha/beta hydrolase [Acuticoccus sp. M5D2P5]|uniref:alpha/beta hydrolase n=1 Tax=Acuticoccus kalidii TaxID=2910977 RepID=UPI001F3B9917|nr:alpha/beta hydrolase [Acuticoccus kalidii]MCF3935679.1 alpha/beta hydrolase [Acuticoccus kalidii]